MAYTLEHDILATGSWQSDVYKWMQNVNAIVNELQTVNTEMASRQLTRIVTPATFVIDTNFDIKNSVAFEIEVNGVLKTVAANVNWNTGTATVIATNAYWACALLSINVDGSTTYVNWGAQAVDQATAKANLAAVTATGSVVCGYVAVQAKAAQDFVAGTDALTTGTGGQVAQVTTYYNDIKVGAAYVASIAASTLTNSTALKLTKG